MDFLVYYKADKNLNVIPDDEEEDQGKTYVVTEKHNEYGVGPISGVPDTTSTFPKAGHDYKYRADRIPPITNWVAVGYKAGAEAEVMAGRNADGTVPDLPLKGEHRC